jgi:hypothetical protein
MKTFAIIIGVCSIFAFFGMAWAYVIMTISEQRDIDDD